MCIVLYCAMRGESHLECIITLTPSAMKLSAPLRESRENPPKMTAFGDLWSWGPSIFDVYKDLSYFDPLSLSVGKMYTTVVRKFEVFLNSLSLVDVLS